MGENFEAFKEKIWFDFEGAEKEETINLNTFSEKYYNGIKNYIVPVAAFVTVLNHRCWHWYQENDELSSLYSNLYYKYNEKAWEWLEQQGTDEEKTWYFKTMD